MKRAFPLMAIAIPLAALGLTVSAAFAASPHFTWSYPGVCPQTGGIAIQFQEAGLGPSEGVDLRVSASATGTYVCGGVERTVTWNPIGMNPVAVPVYVPKFAKPTNPATSDKNGEVDGWLFYPPDRPTCDGVPVQWKQVTYENIQLIDAAHNLDLPMGTVARTVFMPLQ